MPSRSPSATAAKNAGASAKTSASNANLIRTTDGFLLRARLYAGRHRQARSASDHAGARHSATTRNEPSAGPRSRRRRIQEESEVRRGDVGGPRNPLDLFRVHLRQGQSVGHGDRPDLLHRLQCLRGRLPGGEQHSGGRQGSGAARPRNALDPHGPLLLGRRERSAKWSSSRSPACSAKTRPAKTFARCRPPRTAPKA